MISARSIYLAGTIRDIADRERVAALAGHGAWRNFVYLLVTTTGLPWEYLRDQIEEFHRGGAA